jgi:hypothetical protein
VNARGLLIWAHDFSPFLIRRASKARLTTLALHPIPNLEEDDPRSLESFLETSTTELFRSCAQELKDLGIDMEIEAHAMHWLMPREQFDSHPDWFRMSESGERRGDVNFCPSNEYALRYLESRTEILAQRLAPVTTTHRYYLWIDDNSRFCHCPRCADLSPSDQALLICNRMLKGVRRVDPQGSLCYLAYQNTITAPVSVEPSPGIFLEYAPINRDSRFSMDDASIRKNVSEGAHIGPLLECFGEGGSQVLEYWMDNSYFYRWTPPYGELPFYRGVLARDIRFYRCRGFEHIKSFACGLNEEYEKEYGEAPIAEYGRILLREGNY